MGTLMYPFSSIPRAPGAVEAGSGGGHPLCLSGMLSMISLGPLFHRATNPPPKPSATLLSRLSGLSHLSHQGALLFPARVFLLYLPRFPSVERWKTPFPRDSLLKDLSGSRKEPAASLARPTQKCRLSNKDVRSHRNVEHLFVNAYKVISGCCFYVGHFIFMSPVKPKTLPGAISQKCRFLRIVVYRLLLSKELNKRTRKCSN